MCVSMPFITMLSQNILPTKNINKQNSHNMLTKRHFRYSSLNDLFIYYLSFILHVLFMSLCPQLRRLFSGLIVLRRFAAV